MQNLEAAAADDTDDTATSSLKEAASQMNICYD